MARYLAEPGRDWLEAGKILRQGRRQAEMVLKDKVGLINILNSEQQGN